MFCFSSVLGVMLLLMTLPYPVGYPLCTFLHALGFTAASFHEGQKPCE